MPDDPDLETLLDSLRDALRRADFAALGAVLPLFEAHLAGPIAPPDAATLLRLQAKARRNARLLQATGRGIRAARQRLQEIATGGRGLSTYDGRGQRSDLATGGNPGRRV